MYIDKKKAYFCKKNAIKFAYVKKKQYFCTRFSEKQALRRVSSEVYLGT